VLSHRFTLHLLLLSAELAPECASAYYRYGAALLYQAQDSADVFGAGVADDADDDDAPEDGEAGARLQRLAAGGEVRRSIAFKLCDPLRDPLRVG